MSQEPCPTEDILVYVDGRFDQKGLRDLPPRVWAQGHDTGGTTSTYKETLRCKIPTKNYT